MERKTLSKVMIALLLPLIFIGFNTVKASSTEVSIDYYGSPYVFDTTLVPGTQFTVNMSLDYVEPNLLWAYQLTLSFNPDVLHGVSVENGPFLGSNGGDVHVITGQGFNNIEGSLWLFAGYLDPIRRFPKGGSDEYGALATITFEVVGYGVSQIRMGSPVGLTALVNRTGGYMINKRDNPEAFIDGFFCNSPGPQLWIQGAHGAQGGGAYPEWHVNLAGEMQIFYSKIANSGDAAAWIKVKFTFTRVESSESGYCWSNKAEVPGVYRDPDTGEKVIPLITVQTNPFIPFLPRPWGRYTVTACLYFKASGMTEYIPYELVEIGFGGDGTSRDPATKFKVVENM